MKVIKPFFIGLLGGLALSLVLLVGLYFSPLREAVYFGVDPELQDVRGKLSQYRDWLSQADLYIQEKGPETSDSLQTAQTLAWREYKKWRTHLGELARAHAKPTAEGFWTWTYSLRYWGVPMAACLAFFPALLLAWRSNSRYRAGRVTLRPVGGRVKYKTKTKAQNQAISSFEEAIKKVARISENDRKANAAPAMPPEPMDSYAEDGRDTQVEERHEPPTTPIPITDYIGEEDPEPEPTRSQPPHRDPDTKPFAIVSDTGLETNFLQTGPVWGEPVNPIPSDTLLGGSGIPAPGPNAAAGLSMEDEDGDADDDSRGQMPPTTEVERVERRKVEVLKLARKGLTSSEISRRMRISQDQVEFIIRLRREKG
jgi:hypothetical protein